MCYPGQQVGIMLYCLQMFGNSAGCWHVLHWQLLMHDGQCVSAGDGLVNWSVLGE